MPRALSVAKAAAFAIAVAVTFVFTESALGAPPPAETGANPIPKLKVETLKLSNGLTVFLYEDHTVPLVAVNVNYMVGSKNEKPGRTGFAHLFEHMMFQGSKHFNDDYFKPLQEIGGNVNGATNADRTRYFEVVPAPYLERALWMESDRMGFLLDSLTQERLDNQRSVVQNERRQNYENRPYGMVREKVAAVMYPPNHPYSWTTIGSMADLSAATVEDVKEFFRTYYTPNNASLCVAGDFDPKTAKELIEKYFGAIPPGPPVSRLSRWVPALTGEVTLEIQDRVQLPRTTISWLTVPNFSEDDAALDAFARVLGHGKTSRLYKKLVYELQIAQDVAARNGGEQIAGTFSVTVTPRPGHGLEEVEKAALAVLAEALEKGITAEELQRVKTATTAQFVRSMQTVGGFSGISDRLNEYYHYLGEPDMFRTDLERTLELTPGKVTAAARKYLGANRLVARVRPLPPLSPATAGAAATVDRSRMPGKGADRALVLPDRKRFDLHNGLHIVLVEHHAVPLVSATLLVRGGAAADPAARPGLASLTAGLLTEGAAGKSASEIAEAIEGIGAELNASATADATFVTLSALKTRLDESLGLFADVVTRPDFTASEVERARKRRLVQLRQQLDQADVLARTAVQRVLFHDHPYGHPANGTPRGIGQVTQDDVKGFWKSWYVPSNATLIVVGDVTKGDLLAKLERTFGAWKGEKAPTLDLSRAPQHLARTVYLIDKPGAAQSVISAGLVGADRRTKDYAALEVLNTAFGGAFVSRLNLNLREDKGYTYGARSAFHFGLVPGSFTAGAPVQTKVTGPALTETVAELEAIVGRRPLDAKEIAYAQGTLVNGYARRFETPAQIARQLAEDVLYGLPENALETFPKEIEGVTAADVSRAAASTILPAKLAIVVVGDLGVIRPEIEKLNLGPIVVLDKEGNPAAAK